jgi:hypothetical protein
MRLFYKMRKNVSIMALCLWVLVSCAGRGHHLAAAQGLPEDDDGVVGATPAFSGFRTSYRQSNNLLRRLSPPARSACGELICPPAPGPSSLPASKSGGARGASGPLSSARDKAGPSPSLRGGGGGPLTSRSGTPGIAATSSPRPVLAQKRQTPGNQPPAGRRFRKH